MNYVQVFTLLKILLKPVLVFFNLNMKILGSKLTVRPGIIAISFDEKSIFSTILAFTTHWDYKHYNENLSQKITNLSTINKV